MKSSLWLRVLLLSLMLHAGAMALIAAALMPPLPPGATVPIVLSFDYPTNGMDTNLVFVLRGTTNVGTATPWPVETTIPAMPFWTNAWALPVNGTNYTITFTNQTIPDIHFWYVTATNFWGESDPSNVLGLPPLPTNTKNLKAARGW